MVRIIHDDKFSMNKTNLEFVLKIFQILSVELFEYFLDWKHSQSSFPLIIDLEPVSGRYPTENALGLRAISARAPDLGFENTTDTPLQKMDILRKWVFRGLLLFNKIVSDLEIQKFS